MIKPLGQRILVKRDDAEEKTAAGIYIPGNAQEKPQYATVVAVGTGGLDSFGNPFTFTVKPGDHVMITKYGSTEVNVDGETYLLMQESDVLAIL